MIPKLNNPHSLELNPRLSKISYLSINAKLKKNESIKFICYSCLRLAKVAVTAFILSISLFTMNFSYSNSIQEQIKLEAEASVIFNPIDIMRNACVDAWIRCNCTWFDTPTNDANLNSIDEEWPTRIP